MHTSTILSKLLAENGCELESDYFRLDNAGDLMTEEQYEREDFTFVYKKTPAYDILNDICVKYAKEFFGEEEIEIEIEKLDNGGEIVTKNVAYRHRSLDILCFLQEEKTQEAEDYFWEHCLFNPKNK